MLGGLGGLAHAVSSAAVSLFRGAADGGGRSARAATDSTPKPASALAAPQAAPAAPPARARFSGSAMGADRTGRALAGAEAPAAAAAPSPGLGLEFSAEGVAAEAEERMPEGRAAPAGAEAHVDEEGFEDQGFWSEVPGRPEGGPVRMRPPLALSAVQDGTVGDLQRRLGAAPGYGRGLYA